MEYHYFTTLRINTLVGKGNVFRSTKQYIHSKAKADNNASNYWYLERRQDGGEWEIVIVYAGDH